MSKHVFKKPRELVFYSEESDTITVLEEGRYRVFATVYSFEDKKLTSKPLVAEDSESTMTLDRLLKKHHKDYIYIGDL
jgi:hypothetical protein